MIQKSADILFVGLSFDASYPLLINTSSPGKLAEFLVSGRPIIIHAPRQSYISWYARTRNFAYVVDKDDVEFLEQGLQTLLSSSSLCRTFTQNAWKTALENHNAQKNAAEFQSFFSDR